MEGAEPALCLSRLGARGHSPTLSSRVGAAVASSAPGWPSSRGQRWSSMRLLWNLLSRSKKHSSSEDGARGMLWGVGGSQHWPQRWLCSSPQPLTHPRAPLRGLLGLGQGQEPHRHLLVPPNPLCSWPLPPPPSGDPAPPLGCPPPPQVSSHHLLSHPKQGFGQHVYRVLDQWTDPEDTGCVGARTLESKR